MVITNDGEKKPQFNQMYSFMSDRGQQRPLCGGSYRPGGRLCCARLLEGHVEGVGAGVICVGRDGRRGREGVEGGAGLSVRRRGRDVVLRVVVVVRAGGRRASVLNVLIHAVQEPQVCVLRLQKNGKSAKKRGFFFLRRNHIGKNIKNLI